MVENRFKKNHHLCHEVLRLHELGPHAVHHGLYRGHLLELCHELLRIGRMIVLPFWVLDDACIHAEQNEQVTVEMNKLVMVTTTVSLLIKKKNQYAVQ